MIAGVFALIFFTILAFFIIQRLKQRYAFVDTVLLGRLVYFHWFMSMVYYIYVQFNRSDSFAYFARPFYLLRGPNWFDYYGTSTTFIDFIGFPFINYLGFTYEVMMVLFAFLGLLGFFYFYIFFNESIKTRPTLFGVNLLTLFMFLPNMHFWSGSYGKGSIILFGISLYFYSLKKPSTRIIALLIGSLIIYHVRPHIMFVMLISTVLGLSFSSKGVGLIPKLLLTTVGVFVFIYIYADILTLVGLEQDDIFIEGLDLSKRAASLTGAGSGIDIQNYNFFEKLFAFLYRPLFFDSPDAMGLFVSLENFFYLSLTIYFFFNGGVLSIIRGDVFVKTAFFSFITVSIALAQISGNLGLAIRQKSQVMMLLLFVILKFMDDKKMKEIKRVLLARKKEMSTQQPR